MVATDVGGVGEVVRPGASGFLVPPGDPEGLAAAMAAVMGLPEEARRGMGLKGRQWVKENFSIESVLDSWEGIYQSLWERKG